MMTLKATLIALLCLVVKCLGKDVQAEMHNMTYNTSFPDSNLPNSKGCSRQASRAARKIILLHIYWYMQRYGPPYFPDEPGCPWNLERDLFLFHETMKREKRGHTWQCMECGQTFDTEPFMDRHLDKYHPDSIIDKGICLASYCDILKCDWYEKEIKQVPCRPAVMQRRKMECRAILTSCFPPSWGGKGELFWNTFNQDICENLKCQRHPEDKTKLIHVEPVTPRKTKFWRKVGAFIFVVGLVFLAGAFWVYKTYANPRTSKYVNRIGVELHNPAWFQKARQFLKDNSLSKGD